MICISLHSVVVDILHNGPTVLDLGWWHYYIVDAKIFCNVENFQHER